MNKYSIRILGLNCSKSLNVERSNVSDVALFRLVNDQDGLM